MRVFFAGSGGLGIEGMEEYRGRLPPHSLLLSYFHIAGREAWVFREVSGGDLLQRERQRDHAVGGPPDAGRLGDDEPVGDVTVPGRRQRPIPDARGGQA